MYFSLPAFSDIDIGNLTIVLYFLTWKEIVFSSSSIETPSVKVPRQNWRMLKCNFGPYLHDKPEIISI